MTKDEIKQTYSMANIVERYGLKPNRAGFIRCPFHQGDHTASLKIYKDSFHCFGCGASGDIFKFVMLMDGVSFKDAFLSLGGEYQKESKIESLHRSRDLIIAERKREQKKKEQQKQLQRLRAISRDIDTYRNIMKAWEPLTDEWCDCMDGLQSALFEYECIWEEVKDIINDRTN